MLVPGSLALIIASFYKGRGGRAIGTWSGFTAITTAFGPVLGGFLIDYGSWRYAFFLNVPLSVAVLALTFRYVPESHGASSRDRLDWLGAALATLGLGGIVYALIEAQIAGWSNAAVIVSLAVGLPALPRFLAVESRQPAAVLALPLFSPRDFAGASLLTLMLYAALAGSLFFLPLNLIQVQGYSTAGAGAALLPFVLLMFVLSRWAGGLVERYGAKAPLVIGPTIAACGFALFAVPGIGGSYWTTFFPAALVLGFGMTLTVAPLTTTVMQSVVANAVGTASGINNAVSSVAGVFGSGSFGVGVSGQFHRGLHARLLAADLPPTITQAVESQRAKLAAIEPMSNTQPETRVAIRSVIAESFIPGFRRIMLIAALLALASAI